MRSASMPAFFAASIVADGIELPAEGCAGQHDCARHNDEREDDNRDAARRGIDDGAESASEAPSG